MNEESTGERERERERESEVKRREEGAADRLMISATFFGVGSRPSVAAVLQPHVTKTAATAVAVLSTL